MIIVEFFYIGNFIKKIEYIKYRENRKKFEKSVSMQMLVQCILMYLYKLSTHCISTAIVIAIQYQKDGKHGVNFVEYTFNTQN